MRHDAARVLDFRGLGQGMTAVAVVENHRAVISAKGFLRDVSDEERKLFPPPLVFGIAVQILALGGEAHAKGSVSLGGNGRENVGGRLQFQS